MVKVSKDDKDDPSRKNCCSSSIYLMAVDFVVVADVVVEIVTYAVVVVVVHVVGTVVGMWLHLAHVAIVVHVANVAHMAPADHTVFVVVRIANFMGSKVVVDLTVELLAILVVVAVVVVVAAVVVVVEMVDDSFEIVLVEDMVHSLATVVWEILVRLQESSALRDKVVVVVDMAPFRKKLVGREILKV